MIWAALRERGWTDAKLGAEMREDSAAISRLLYGDRPANRKQAAWFYTHLGIPLEAWDRSCTVKRRKHAPATSAVLNEVAHARAS